MLATRTCPSATRWAGSPQDPGVGSSRKAVVVKSKRGQFFVLPDNGLMTMVAARELTRDLPQRAETWVNQPEKMYQSKESSPYKDGRARFANALYTYTPNFATTKPKPKK